MRQAAFAIPGDITTLTGGYIYERRLLEGLRAQGRDVAHLQLPGSYPAPPPADLADAVATLCAVPPDRALILDGFVSGATETAGLSRVRAPMVAMVHHPLAMETGLDQATRDRLFRTERDNLARVARILVPSPHTADMLIGHYGVAPDRITVARPGTDARPRLRQPTEPRLILAVGLQHPRKGHDVLFRALSRITDLDWRCVVAGPVHDPDYAAQLSRLVGTLELGERVTLAGPVDGADLHALYAAATVFALATRYEGYGMVFDEALSWGLPIVTCATGAVPRTVPDSAGLLVPPDIPEAFATALRRMLSDTALRERLTSGAAAAGAQLPSWDDTAAIAGAVLDAL